MRGGDPGVRLRITGGPGGAIRPMAILAIVQFEVHCYQDGRWTLQSRYPGDERQRAITDAHATEEMTRRPAKVVKETYYPHENRSDSVTVYMSPRAKDMIAKLKKPAVGHASEKGAARAAKGLEARTSGIKTTARAIAPKAADIFWRAVISMGLSLGAATVVTAMMSWLLSRMANFGLALDPNTLSTILTLTYLAVFLLGVFALFRFGTPIKRLIAMLWASAGPSAGNNGPTSAADIKAAGFRLRPKGNKVPFEQQQETADMKRMRGDLDTVAPIDFNAGDPPGQVPGIPELSPPMPVDPKAQKKPEKKPEAPAQPPPVVEAPVAPPASLDENKTPIPPQADTAAHEPAFSQAVSDLHRSLAMRFATEVMLPQIARAPDDPVARRGSALFLTGAMAHLAAVSGLGEAGEMGLTMSALPATLPRHAVDAFMSQYAKHTSVPANTMLMTQGRQAMARFLAGQSSDNSLAQCLSAWRVPPPTFLIPPPTQADSVSSDLPTDFYLMTELRTEDASLMDTHNHVVREALETADGREVKHTGRGILARFQRADEAVQAAFALTEKLKAAPALADVAFVTALVAGYGTPDDPLLSTTATKTAQSMVEKAPRGTIIAQPAVYQNAHASQNTIHAEPFAASWLMMSETKPIADLEKTAPAA